MPPWRILSGLVVSGFLLALPGGLLPLWGFHIRQDFGTAANSFLVLGVGTAGGAAAALRFRNKFPVKHLLATGCFAAALSLLLLSLAAPPASFWYPSLALLIAGLSAGAVNTAVFESIALAYEANPAKITLTGGIFFGVGSILAAYLLAECLDSSSPARLLAITALIPAAAGAAFERVPLPQYSLRPLPVADVAKDLRSALAIMFALLLFFQFASEWSIAGWLPVFLIDRLGLSPGTAVQLLAIYWLALTVAGLSRRACCPSSGMASMLADQRILRSLRMYGAACGREPRLGRSWEFLLTGAGFSAIYPLAAERIARPLLVLPSGLFQWHLHVRLDGRNSCAFRAGPSGGRYWFEVIPLAAMTGSCAVFGLVLLIWLGHKVSGQLN